MKKFVLLAALGCSLSGYAQLSLGVKAGLNFANVSRVSSINNTNKTGFMFGGYISPRIGVIGYRSEIIFSRQGYDFKTSTNTGNVNMDYLLLPQLLTVNLGRIISLQAGGQIAFLLNAKADSTNNNGSSGTYSDLKDYMNRLDYGLVFGGELNLVKGLLVGARYNISLANAFKDPQTQQPNFIPNVNAKNNVVQLYIGWRLGR